jgi:hypothetical protein
MRFNRGLKLNSWRLNVRAGEGSAFEHEDGPAEMDAAA